MPLAPWIALGALFLTILAYAVISTIWVSKIEMRCIDRVSLVAAAADAALHREIGLQDQGRHDQRNEFHEHIQRLQEDIATTNSRFDLVARKEDLIAHEARLMAALDKLEARMYTMFENRPGLRIPV